MLVVMMAVLSLSLPGFAKSSQSEPKKIYLNYADGDKVKSRAQKQKRIPAKISDDDFASAINESSRSEKRLQHKISKKLNVKKDNVRLRSDLSQEIQRFKPESENIVVQSDVFEEPPAPKRNDEFRDKGLRRISEEINQAQEK